MSLSPTAPPVESVLETAGALGGSKVEGTPPHTCGWWGLEAEPQLPAPTQKMTACAGVEPMLRTSTCHLDIL